MTLCHSQQSSNQSITFITIFSAVDKQTRYTVQTATSFMLWRHGPRDEW